jgi:hypothetical protein
MVNWEVKKFYRTDSIIEAVVHVYRIYPSQQKLLVLLKLLQKEMYCHFNEKTTEAYLM